MVRTEKLLLFAGLGLLSFLFISCSSLEQSSLSQVPYGTMGKKSVRIVRTTAYTHTEKDHRKYRKLTSRGTRLQYGSIKSAAADWSVYPVGTRFRIVGMPHLYEIDDYGTALVGKKTIDLYMPTKSMMNQWGVRYVPIEIVRWGSFNESLRIMEGRQRYSHVRKMVSSILRKQKSQLAKR